MKITCILTSFNRPQWVRQALESVAEQTHPDFELILIDESTEFDIKDALKGLSFPALELIHYVVTEEERKKTNRLSININKGLKIASGDLFCYLADDDYYYPGWFKAASAFFELHPKIGAGFGRLFYSESRERVYPKDTKVRFFNTPIGDPFCRLDHNQIIHRRMIPTIWWPEGLEAVTAPDGLYAREVAKKHTFYPIHEDAAVKRIHEKNLNPHIHRKGMSGLGGLRE